MFKNILKFLKPFHAEAKPAIKAKPAIRKVETDELLTREQTLAQRAKKMAAETTLLPKEG